MHTDITSLRRGFTGQILLPDEDGYHPGTAGPERDGRQASCGEPPLRGHVRHQVLRQPGKDIRDARQGHQLRHRLLPGRHEQP